MQPNQQPYLSQTTPAAPAVYAAPPDQRPAKNSTQNTLLFEEIRDSMVVMGDGTFRAVVAAQSINFDLMSERERDGVEQSYADFLNSLTFPVQIYIRSQRVDIKPYMDKLTKLRDEQENMLLGVLMDDYLQFIDALSQEANIMDKSFFVIIPYEPGEEAAKIGSSSSNKFPLKELFSVQNTHQKMKIPAKTYEKSRDEMQNHVNVILEGLEQIGVRAVRLKTREIAQLYYNIYNPDTALKQPIGDFRNYAGFATKKGDGFAPQVNMGEI